MRLTISNLNIVGHADISINGLAVIAGENGTGKSTIGKTLFTTLKAIASSSANIAIDREQAIARLADPAFGRLFRLRLSDSGRPLDTMLPPSRAQFIADICAITTPAGIDSYFAPILEAIHGSSIADPLAGDICAIKDYISTLTDHKGVMASSLNRLLHSEFLGNISSAGAPSSQVSLTDEQSDLSLYYDIDKGKTSVTSLTGPVTFRDATYIESPLYLHLLDILSKVTGARLFDSGDTAQSLLLPAHVADIVGKIESLRYLSDNGSTQAPRLTSTLSQLAGGEFYYDPARHVIMFRQGDNEIVPLNVASGVKSLGLLQILLDNRIVTPDRPLIWDEPENHLHPKWQIRLAQFLVILASQGIPVIVSTHSPYFIQGIRYFAVKLNAEQFVDYYLAELSGNASVTHCVNDDLNRIFIKLASPLNEIMDLP